ncbi:MAG TPA: GNAT family N-acetyltransferase [Candidatus Deferrimicrobium sp.]|nr:GNAT family N-acetyltransferase [Candidatus Deferrimicrobium sp.]
MIYKKAETLNEIGKAFILRYKVFVLEQGFGEDIEIDQIDNISFHLIAKENEKVIGTLRLFKKATNIMLGRMAIDKNYRKKGIGHALISKAMQEAKNLGGDYIIAHSQLDALKFYQKNGFKQYGAEFMEDGAPHIEVRYDLRLT